ncbi:insulin-like 5a isoform X2 [Heterodontus francisci]|uniref:insulin-like 5a isoform X2 n=1 Tax=Heterodontus francisci TaxID=7792 RepID=UPI00355B5797
MRSMTLAALLGLIAVFAVSRVRADRPHVVKLCGREFLRAVIYTCGGSRWRREPGSETALRTRGLREDQKSPFLENSDLSSFQNWSPDFSQRLESSSEEDLTYKPDLLEETLEAFQSPSRDKRELSQHLTAVCCQKGCNKRQLSSLC